MGNCVCQKPMEAASRDCINKGNRFKLTERKLAHSFYVTSPRGREEQIDFVGKKNSLKDIMRKEVAE